MTPDDPDRPRPDRPDAGSAEVDELASALLDGALSGADEDEARQRPDVVARAAEMEAARGALRAGTPTPSAEARERAVAAALAAFDEVDTPAGTTPGASDASGSGHDAVPDLMARRGGRPGLSVPSGPPRADLGRRGAPRWLGAAAAVAAVVAGVAGLAIASSGSSDDDEAASMGDATETAPEGAEAPLADGDEGRDGDDRVDDGGSAGGERPDAGDFGSNESAPSAPSPTVPVEVGHLGSFPSVDDLVDQVGALDDAGGGIAAAPDLAARSSAEALDRLGPVCGGELPGSLTGPTVTLRLHATALVTGEPVDVWSTDDPEGRRLVVLAADCTVMVDRPVS